MKQRQADAQDLWQRTLTHLEGRVTKATFATWLADTKAVDLTTDGLVILAPNQYARDWLEHRLLQLISRALADAAGHAVNTAFITQYPPPRRKPATDPPPPKGPTAGGTIAIELVSFDPANRGWVQCSNYAIRFWQPYLRPRPFALWLTLRSFAWHADRDAWPTINTLASICTHGNRHLVLGRNARASRPPTKGALQVLEDERIVWTKRRGTGPTASYTFRVLDGLPLLTPGQLATLPENLVAAHARFLHGCEVDRDEWQQLTLPTLCPGHST